MKTVINISADKIAFFRAGKVDFLDRNGVDLEIGKKLVKIDQEHPLKTCLVINGPGGFTNLRVGTLALNLMKTLKEDQICFFSLSKLELYQKAFVQWFLPRYGVMYIGQKMNVWLWDFEKQELFRRLKKSDIPHLHNELGDFFCDEVYEEGYFDTQEQLAVSYDEEGAHLYYQGQKFCLAREELLINPVEKLEPNYMIEPNVN